MNKLLNRIYKKLRFSSILFKKSVTQNFKTHNEGFSYLSDSDVRLKDLLDKRNVEKSEAAQYHRDLSNALYRSFRTSDISYKDICEIVAGKLVYSKSGFTPDAVQQVLVDNYCKTNGLFQEVLFDFMNREPDQNYIVEGKSIFGNINEDEILKAANEVQRSGYSKIPFTLPTEKINELVSWSKNLDYTIIDDSLNGKYFKSKVDFENIQYAKASASEDDLKNNNLVMKICLDPFLVSVIQSVLGSKVDILHLAMWWSFNIGKPSSEAAQYFHYDLDSLRWLKVFIYLTDVGPNNGPHIAIPGSHKLGGKNYKLLRKRYNRVTDQEMSTEQSGEVVEFHGKAGTIIIGDTRCWHKGKEVMEGNRLILQPTFAPSMFLKKLV